MSTASDCDCGYNGDLFLCIKATVYGPCENENCGGVCEPVGDCSCDCHAPDYLVAKQALKSATEE